MTGMLWICAHNVPCLNLRGAAGYLERIFSEFTLSMQKFGWNSLLAVYIASTLRAGAVRGSNPGWRRDFQHPSRPRLQCKGCRA
jgi:hypothetical protein